MDYLNVEEVTDETEIGRIVHEKILNDFCTGCILIGKDRMTISSEYLKYADEIKKFEVKDNDIWVASYPKTGTTWTQEMVWMICNNLDFEGGQNTLYSRFPFLEISALFDREKLLKTINSPDKSNYVNSIEKTKNFKSPRFIKTHLPFCLLPDQFKDGTRRPKVVYVMRNPKDTCVSYCHHGNTMENWRIDLESFAKLFLADKAMYGSFWKHIFGYWNQRNYLNILFIKYEDMKADLPAVIKMVAKFLEKDLTEPQIELLAKHLSFKSMKNNKSLNREEQLDIMKKSGLVHKDGTFMRSGTVKKYKEELNPETIKKFDAWIRENVVGTSFESEYDFNW